MSDERNDAWLDDLRAEPVDLEPRPGFQAELRATIAAERSRGAAPAPTPATGRPRWWMLAAVAACLGLLGAGLVAFGGGNDTLTPATVPVPSTDGGTPATTAPATTAPQETIPEVTVVPASADLTVTDLRAISLDEWIDADAALPIADDIVGIDRDALPAGWSVSDEDGRLLLYPGDMSGYRYTATVTTDDQTSYTVTFVTDELLGSDPCFLPTAGFAGTVGDLTGATVGDAVCGRTADGADLAVVPVVGSVPAATSSALDVANTLRFAKADDVPHPDLAFLAADRDEPDVVDFAGTLSGARWAVTVEPAGTRRMDNYIAGNFSSGMEASNIAVTVGQESPVVESLLEGVPGYGAVVYGHVEGDAVAVIATTNDGETARLPMLAIDGRSAFAVPIPDGVDIDTLTFVDADGSVIAIGDVPDVPRGYGGGFLSLLPRR